MPQAMDNGFSTLLDAMGFNYKPDNYIRFHQRYPNQFFFSTESASTISSRGEYFFPVVGPGFGTVNGRGRVAAAPTPSASQDDTNHQMSSYDLYHPGWATSPDHEFFGQDHTPPWPANLSGPVLITSASRPLGATQTTHRVPPTLASSTSRAFPKIAFISIRPIGVPISPWRTFCRTGTGRIASGKVTPVHVYTSGDEAELFLNGKSLGRKKKIFETPNNPRLNGQPAYRIRWDDVAYEPGELKVVAYKDGKKWATDTVKTTGAAKQL